MPTAQAPPASSSASEIVSLESVHYRVIVAAGLAGPVYSIRGRDGREIARELSLDQLRAEHPSIYADLAPALATNVQNTRGFRPFALADDGAR